LRQSGEKQVSVNYKIYDWPSVVKPTEQLFYSGGQLVEGGFTSGGARMMYPEPGGRSVLELTFDYQQNYNPNPIISWLITMIRNGNIFRVPVRYSPQLVKRSDLGVSYELELSGLPWAEAGETVEGPWSNNQNWAYSPAIAATATVLEGSVTFTIDFGDTPLVLSHGHLIGHFDYTYLIEDIEYNGTIATITVNTPLRKTIAPNDFILFRPKMLCVARNPDNLRGLYNAADLIKLGSLELLEVIL
jgi:hypothetical protein